MLSKHSALSERSIGPANNNNNNKKPHMYCFLDKGPTVSFDHVGDNIKLFLSIMKSLRGVLKPAAVGLI